MASSLFIIALGIFAIGVVAGIIWVVSLGSRREDRDPFLLEEGPNNLTRGARRLTGLYVRREAEYHSLPSSGRQAGQELLV
jgi:hypothetical protein